MSITQQHVVGIIGAGPAGLFAARELANNGVRVVLFNRDIKPGGLAEYGIYPTKHRMKEGLRAQFRQILAMENITYYGNVLVGQEGDLTLADLREFGFQALLVTAGAQATKWLGLPGERLKGVYHAKDLVYHYNRLPPYCLRGYPIGQRVAIIGVGNVMMDIARYLITEIKVEEVMAFARRGPGEVKFDKHELETIVTNLDFNALKGEIERIAPNLLQVGQDPQTMLDPFASAWQHAQPTDSTSRMTLNFLASPARIVGDSHGQVCTLQVEKTVLSNDGGEIRARSTGERQDYPVDTVIFAIGDLVDGRMGLPLAGNGFAIRPNPLFPVDALSYEVSDPSNESITSDVFVAGWSRNASYGLVGIARKDGTNGAKAVLAYLQNKPNPDFDLGALERWLHATGKPIFTQKELLVLEMAEHAQAVRSGAEEFKFASNQEMVSAVELS